MAQIVVQDLEFLYEEISSTVRIESAPDVVLMPSPEICQLKTLDSLEAAMQAINEFEESTISNYTVVEKKKHFGNEAFKPTSKLTVHWEGPFINNVSLNEYSGVPFMIVGRKVLGCHLGRDKALAQKRKYAEMISQREIELMRNAQNNCPAKIYVYHILKFPDFQIAKKTRKQMKEASRKIRDSLEQNSKLNHSYIILFPQLSPHENHPVDVEEMMLSHESYQLEMFHSLENALQAISEFEESTNSNYIVLEKQKDFGDEEFRPSGKFTLHWKGPVIDDVSLLEYSGVPFIIVGRQVLGCHFGKDRAAAQKRPAEFASQTEIAYCPLVKRRKLIMQNTKKMNCPAKIYIYHIMKFPDFQIKKKSKWQMKLASKKIKNSLDTTVELIHSYIILFPQFSHHKNHPVEGEDALTKERVDPRIIKKITELFESGVSKRRDIKILLDHFVRFELFVGQDIPVNSRRRFFPSLKDIDNITRRVTSKQKSPAVDQNTETHLLT
ncbi:uncharacterized protein LOC143764550 [Ranitomeya variabilis]|uniref:uncharacterized protein LOC143764550 n=1 Tax=Ranitomeya variabilis TaxID=490064 RepID=UPI004057031C